MWYHWGNREKVGVMHHPDFALIVPSSEQLQRATTWISPAPSSLITGHPIGEDTSDSYSPNFHPMTPLHTSDSYSPAYSTIAAPTTLMSPLQLTTPLPSALKSPIQQRDRSTQDDIALSQHQLPENIEKLYLVGDVVKAQMKSGCPVWEPFFARWKLTHKRMHKWETAVEKQRRESRERQPPTTSAPIYEWDWDTDDPTQFT